MAWPCADRAVLLCEVPQPRVSDFTLPMPRPFLPWLTHNPLQVAPGGRQEGAAGAGSPGALGVYGRLASPSLADARCTRLQGVVERFVSADTAAMLRSSFAGLWALDDDGAASAIDAAIEDPLGYVLKPQREGGGNNLYGDDMVSRLRDGTGLGAFILMQRIQPQKHRALFMRLGKVTASVALCELGVYSVYLGRRGKPTEALRNDAVGHLLRTKTANSNEGGVAAGFAVLDSPLLI